MLFRVAEIVNEGGRALASDFKLRKTPSKEAITWFGDGIPALADLVRVCREATWTTLHISLADQRD